MPQHLMMSYMEDAEKGLCKMMNPMQLFMSVLGMCVFPFLGKPLFTSLLGASDEEFNELMEMRKAEIKGHIRSILTP